jgi:uroporphyrinogen-III synthase
VNGRPFVLLTRPREESEALAAPVEARGYNAAIAPMLRIEPLPDIALPDLSAYDGVVFSSANGIHSFQKISEERNLAAWCVGPATARAAIIAGFETIRSGNAGVAGLAQLAEGNEKRLLHVSGLDVREQVELPGVQIDRIAIYDAVPAEELPDDVLGLLDQNAIAAALFFSSRSAECFVRLLGKYGRTGAAKSIKALCLADSVVKSVSAVDWLDVRAAAAPDRSHILALLEPI